MRYLNTEFISNASCISCKLFFPVDTNIMEFFYMVLKMNYECDTFHFQKQQFYSELL